MTENKKDSELENNAPKLNENISPQIRQPLKGEDETIRGTRKFELPSIADANHQKDLQDVSTEGSITSRTNLDIGIGKISHVTDDSTDENCDSNSNANSMSLGEEIECSICLSLLCEPIALPCGHTFCRHCLCRSLNDNRIRSSQVSQSAHKRCPTCRAVCYISPEDHPECVVISKIIKRLYPIQYEQRLTEVKIESESCQRTYPCFFYNLLIFPGHTLRLHLFEARYKLMMQRIVSSSRKFAYVPKFDRYDCNRDDIALIAELKDVMFHPDGSADLEAKIISRAVVEEKYVEDGTHGLFYAKVREIKDVNSMVSSMNDEDKNKFWMLFIAVREKARSLFFCSQNYSSHLVDRYGELPLRNPEDLSLWVTSVLPSPGCFTRLEKQRLLHSTDTMERLSLCHERLLLFDQMITGPENNESEAQNQPNNDLNMNAMPFVPMSNNQTTSGANQAENSTTNENTERPS